MSLICSKPADWPWNSFRATAGLAAKPAFLKLDRVLGYFGDDEQIARRRYISFVAAANAPRSVRNSKHAFSRWRSALQSLDPRSRPRGHRLSGRPRL
jgi:hypothetical protein